jgi:hypothetical protein
MSVQQEAGLQQYRYGASQHNSRGNRPNNAYKRNRSLPYRLLRRLIERHQRVPKPVS